jgi:hypothetical protein
LIKVFLIGVFIVFLTFFLSLFIKRKLVLGAVVVVLVAGIILLDNQLKYTNFISLYSDDITEDSTVEEMTITINHLTNKDDLKPEMTERVKITDEETINDILRDLSTVKLKKDEDANYTTKKYDIKMVVANQISESHIISQFVTIHVDEKYLNQYKIVNETNHLQTIEELANDPNVEWKELK